MLNRPIPLLGLLFIFAVLLISRQPAQAQLTEIEDGKIGVAVSDAIAETGRARVVVALAESAVLNSQRTRLASLQRSVTAVQNSVLTDLDTADFAVTHQYQAIPALSGEILTQEGLHELARNPQVIKIDLDSGGGGGLSSTIPVIGADQWQSLGVTGEGVVIAVLDSGMDTDHSDLAAALIHEECFLDFDGRIDGVGQCPNGSDRQSGTGAAEDGAGHGTNVTGVIASRGNQSSVGVAPGVEIVSIKVTNDSGAGTYEYFSEIVAALDFIINNRPDVQIINMSLVSDATFSGNCDNSASWAIAGASAINTLRANGVIAFAASGNNSSGTHMPAPACLSNVISVGATDDSDNVANFTDSNSTTDVMAPGVSITTSGLNNGTGFSWGTSMASPHAAGCAALLIASGEAVTPDEIETRLKTSSIQVTDATNGLTFPRIDCTPKPPTAVTISGETAGELNTTYTFSATVTPITTTQPITFTWQATDQTAVIQSGDLDESTSFTWGTTGAKTITVTAENNAGVITNTHTIDIAFPPPDSVNIITDSIEFPLGGPAIFTATVTPITAVLPLTYTWQATDQVEIVQSDDLDHTVSFSWGISGTKTITVTAQNDAGMATNAITVTVAPPTPPTAVTIQPHTQTLIGILQTFTVNTTPILTTYPITYTWEVDGYPPLVQVSGTSDTASFMWDTSGTRNIQVTATNSEGMVTDTKTISIHYPLFLPTLIR